LPAKKQPNKTVMDIHDGRTRNVYIHHRRNSWLKMKVQLSVLILKLYTAWLLHLDVGQ